MSRIVPLLLALVLAVATACGSDDPESASTAEQTPTAAVRAVESGGAALLDVRTPAEYEERRAAMAEHIPLDDLKQGDRPDTAKDARLYVYCRTGRRAAEAVEILRRDGWTDVVNVGGLDDWEALGGAAESG